MVVLVAKHRNIKETNPLLSAEHRTIDLNHCYTLTVKVNGEMNKMNLDGKKSDKNHSGSREKLVKVVLDEMQSWSPKGHFQSFL